MTRPREDIVLDASARARLTSLLQTTGVERADVLCRWALSLSLADPTAPPPVTAPASTCVALPWWGREVAFAEIYAGLVRLHCARLGEDASVDVAERLRAHVHRGLALLDERVSDDGPEAIVAAVLEAGDD